MLGVTRNVADCANGVKLNAALDNHVNFTCLEPHHFLPEVAPPFPSRPSRFLSPPVTQD